MSKVHFLIYYNTIYANCLLSVNISSGIFYRTYYSTKNQFLFVLSTKKLKPYFDTIFDLTDYDRLPKN